MEPYEESPTPLNCSSCDREIIFLSPYLYESTSKTHVRTHDSSGRYNDLFLSLHTRRRSEFPQNVDENSTPVATAFPFESFDDDQVIR